MVATKSLMTQSRHPISADMPGSGGLASPQVVPGIARMARRPPPLHVGVYDLNYDSLLDYFFTAKGSFGVEAFFVVSGFIMAWTLSGFRSSL